MEFTTVSGFFVSELEMANNPTDTLSSVSPQKTNGLRLSWTDLQAVPTRKGLRDPPGRSLNGVGISLGGVMVGVTTGMESRDVAK